MNHELAGHLDQLASGLVDYAVLAASVGTIAMAIVDAIKGVTRARSWFHGKMIERWLCELEAQSPSLEGVRVAARTQLLELAAGSSQPGGLAVADDTGLLRYADELARAAWWDQPTERLFARARAAVETALDSPSDYRELYHCLTYGVSDADSWEAATARRANVSGGGDRVSRRGGADGLPQTLTLTEMDQVRARLGGTVGRRVDAFEMRVTWLWARLNQVGAFLIAIVMMATMWTVEGDLGIGLPRLAAITLFGGLLAPLAKDIAGRVSQIDLRTRFYKA